MEKKKKSPVCRLFSAGGLVFKKENGVVFWLLGKHSGYHKWILPKGKIEAGEKSWQTAMREVEEEVGVKTRAIDFSPIHRVSYFYSDKEQGRVFKTVDFFLLAYESGDHLVHDAETEETKWLLTDEAKVKLAFEEEKKALEKAAKKLAQQSLF